MDLNCYPCTTSCPLGNIPTLRSGILKVDINVKIDGKRSSFSISDIGDVQLEGFKNPVTGEEQETKIKLPKGFTWKPADAAKTTTMKMTTPSLNFDHSGKNAFYSVVEYKGP